MSVLINKNTKVIVQGITGKEGSFHAAQCIKYGTKIVAGVTPGKGGQILEFEGPNGETVKVPVFNSVEEAVKETQADASLIFVPPFGAADAILEAANAGLKLAVCITEGIPVNDMLKVKRALESYKDFRYVGPNCPGVITPEECKMGIMPGYIFKKGCVGVVSRSGTLTYEAAYQMTKRGIGQSTVIGIGGDPVPGTTHLDAIKLFNEDPETKAIVLIGEIGGTAEEEAAAYIKAAVTKPVVAYIAGVTAPKGKRMANTKTWKIL
jgi:succinyl-CoA synthetase alpha subunit